MRKFDMDNNKTLAILIRTTLENVKKGITKGTWRYEYDIDIDDDGETASWEEYAGKAVNGIYTIELYRSRCARMIQDYTFQIKKSEQVLLRIKGEHIEDAVSTEIENYLLPLKETQDNFRAKLALNIVSQLPG